MHDAHMNGAQILNKAVTVKGNNNYLLMMKKNPSAVKIRV